MRFSDFQQLWCVDFEFGNGPGENPEPRCMVAREIHSGKLTRLWLEPSGPLKPPISTGPNGLFIAFYASAEMGCYLELKWTLPPYVLDLYTEFRCHTNGLPLAAGRGLLGALSHFGLSHIDGIQKDSMRDLALRGTPYSKKEKRELLDYCQSDVDALAELMKKMKPHIDLPRALIRGEYMKSVASMERQGVSVDKPLFERLQEHWEEIQNRLIERIDCRYGIYEGRTFKRDRFDAYLQKENIPWPRLSSGQLDLKDDTFRKMAKSHPKISPLRELRHSLGRMRLSEFMVGTDGRCRSMLSPFSSKTSRNQPSSSQFIFGSSVWLRGLIKPPPGKALAYIDWSQQEFGIAAALSNDSMMRDAYHSGDPYLAFAKLAGAVPADATKHSHPHERSLFKATVLAVQYGMGAKSLAESIMRPLEEARYLLKKHRQTFRVFWEWSEGCVEYALLQRKIWTTFGWMLHLGSETNTRSLSNFPMQANGAEMLRLACIYMIEENIAVCAPVHDALLIEAPIEEVEDTVKLARRLMAKASSVVLDGFELETDFDVIIHPDRYCDKERGKPFWDEVISILQELES